MLRSRLALLAVLSIVPACAGAAALPVVKGPVAARIDTFMTRCAELGLQGSLLVEQDGQVILHKGYGLADREHRRLAGPDTPYHLGSLGKQFTASAILLLEQRGLLRTSDPIAKYLPGASPAKGEITIDQLLHHTSGLPYLPHGGLDDVLSLDAAVADVMDGPLDFAPGAHYAYSNNGYVLLAAIVERVSGRSYMRFLREELFAPALMSSTSTDDDTVRWAGAMRTPSYTGAEPDPPLYPSPGRNRLTGAGSAVSTTGDLWKWEQALRTHRILDSAATAKLFAPAVKANDNTQYACGWNVVRSARGTKVIMHAGDFGGFNVDYRRLVDEHATIIFLGNARSAGRGYREPVSVAVTRLLFGPPPVMPPARVTLVPKQRAGWTTAWAIADAESIRARPAGDMIVLSARTQAAMSTIAGSDSAGRALEARLSEKAGQVAGQLLAGDLAALRPAFHPSVSESSHPEFVAIWHEVADSVGAGAHAHVLGTAATGPAGGRTLVRLEGARGSRVVALDWGLERLVNTEPVPAAALELSFVPVAPDRVERFDLWAGRTTSITRPAMRAPKRPRRAGTPS